MSAARRNSIIFPLQGDVIVLAPPLLSHEKAFITGIKWQGYIDGKWTDFCERATFEAEDYFNLEMTWCHGIWPFTPYDTAYDLELSHLPEAVPGHGEHRLHKDGMTGVVVPARRLYLRGLQQSDVSGLAHSVGASRAVHTPPTGPRQNAGLALLPPQVYLPAGHAEADEEHEAVPWQGFEE